MSDASRACASPLPQQTHPHDRAARCRRPQRHHRAHHLAQTQRGDRAERYRGQPARRQRHHRHRDRPEVSARRLHDFAGVQYHFAEPCHLSQAALRQRTRHDARVAAGRYALRAVRASVVAGKNRQGIDCAGQVASRRTESRVRRCGHRAASRNGMVRAAQRHQNSANRLQGRWPGDDRLSCRTNPDQPHQHDYRHAARAQRTHPRVGGIEHPAFARRARYSHHS